MCFNHDVIAFFPLPLGPLSWIHGLEWTLLRPATWRTWSLIWILRQTNWHSSTCSDTCWVRTWGVRACRGRRCPRHRMDPTPPTAPGLLLSPNGAPNDGRTWAFLLTQQTHLRIRRIRLRVLLRRTMIQILPGCGQILFRRK